LNIFLYIHLFRKSQNTKTNFGYFEKMKLQNISLKRKKSEKIVQFEWNSNVKISSIIECGLKNIPEAGEDTDDSFIPSANQEEYFSV
jgi:hypothetical protein